MAIGDIVSDADLKAMGSSGDFSIPQPLNQSTPEATFSDADLAAMEDQSKAQSDLNTAATAASADSLPVSQAYGQALTGYSPSFQMDPGTGLGPVQPKTFSTADLDKMEASSLDDPSQDLSREQWDAAQEAKKKVGGSFVGSFISGAPGMIGDLFHTAYGAIKELRMVPNRPKDFGDFVGQLADHGAAVSNSVLQGVRNAGMNTMLNIQKVEQGWQGLKDGSADAGLVDATPEQIKAGADAGYQNYLDNNGFKREIANPAITSVPGPMTMVTPG